MVDNRIVIKQPDFGKIIFDEIRLIDFPVKGYKIEPENMDDMLGIPILPPDYSLRIFSNCVPQIVTWK